MIARQEPFYSKHPRSSPLVSVLETIGDRELPDADPSEEQQRALKDLARSLRTRFTFRELVYLASALAVEANERRAEERLPAA